MEIKIDRDKLAGKSLLIATPMYGGNCKGQFVSSLLKLQAACMAYGVEMVHSFAYNASLIQRGRNDLAYEFMRSHCTHMIFIDADIVFEPLDILAMLASDKELIGGPYPMKSIDWEMVRDLVLAQNEVPVDVLSHMARFYHFNALERIENFEQPVEVYDISTGCMMIARSVFDKMVAAWPDDVYDARYAQDVASGNVRLVHNFFHVSLEDGVLLSEDYYFCKRWRDLGGKLWLLPGMHMKHIGEYWFGGCGVAASQLAYDIVTDYRNKR